jgi:hypothetical protein
VLQRVMVYWALLTFGPILFGLSLTVTSQLFLATTSLADVAPFFSALFYTIISVALTTGAYTLLYTAVPNRYVDWRDAVWGALVAALAFEIAKRGFGVFIRQFPTYTLIYGALAALPLFLIWIYLSWMITLVGAVLASALPVIKYERWWHQPVPGSAFVDGAAAGPRIERTRDRHGAGQQRRHPQQDAHRLRRDDYLARPDGDGRLGRAGPVGPAGHDALGPQGERGAGRLGAVDRPRQAEIGRRVPHVRVRRRHRGTAGRRRPGGRCVHAGP